MRTSDPIDVETPIRPTLLQWLALVELHGSQSAALQELVRAHGELDRLKRAVRALGLSPELLSARRAV
jgi:hypothetical protein